MVNTRNSTRSSSVDPDSPIKSKSPRNNQVSKPSSKKTTAATTPTTWSHTPTILTLTWMAISLPLVCWDTGYVLGRPHTMKGGAWHLPFYAPYDLYGRIDHVYGWKAFDAKNGFTAAQGALNVVETIMYALYMYLYFSRGKVEQTAGKGGVAARRRIDGRSGALACLIGFSAAVMTLSKTVLYGE